MEVDEILRDHISKLHDYNEIKDVAQALVARCADHERVPMKEMSRVLGADSD